MFGKHFQLNEQTMSFVEEIGRHMPGGFFIYKAQAPGELLFANQAVFDIYGCADLEEFRELTGYTFQGMVHPDDYRDVHLSIERQNAEGDEKDFVEYRIIRRDHVIRWVEDYAHFTDTEAYGPIYYVFMSDITDKRERMESDLAVRQAVIEALSESYHTVWLINDVETEYFSLYRGDTSGATTHAAPIRDALGQMKYSAAKEYYIRTTVAASDQERLQEELKLSSIVERLKIRPQYSVNYLRQMDDGSQKYFRIEFAKVDMPGGRMGVVCGFKDVDEDVRQGKAIQKKLQEAKRAEEENLRLMQEVQSAANLAELMGSVSSLLTNMPAMSFSKDAQTGVYLACNQAFAQYAHKKSPEEVVGLTDHEIFDEATADHFVEDDKKALSMEEAYIFFEDVPDAGGVIRNLQTTKTKFLDASGRLCLLGMCVDVTEMTRIKTAEATSIARQQELEEKLQLQAKLLQQQHRQDQQDKMITAMASDYRSVYHVDLDKDEAVCYRADPTDYNQHPEGVHFPYYERFVYYGNTVVDEEYREGFLHFIDPDVIREALSKELIIAYRYLAHRDGKEYYEMLRMAGVRHAQDRDDHIVHAIGLGFTVIDAEMRESMAKSRALAEALTAAQSASRAKTSFLSSMSHEIRTPLNAIIGLNSLALQDEALAPVTREYMEKLGESARHLLGLINDILDMSRIESGRMTLRSEEFSFGSMIDQIGTMVMSQCRDKGLHFELKMDEQAQDSYIGDEMKIKQVLINMLSNAIKFTDPGGMVTLSVERGAAFADQTAIRFIVKDTGIGIDPDYLPRIFDPFTQENSGRSSKYGSTGLGMAITKNIVDMMNGTIQVESEKGRGSEFTVVISLKKGGQAPAAGLSAETASASDVSGKEGLPAEGETACLEGRRILLAEDIQINAEIMKHLLAMRGIEIDHATDGEEAVAMFSGHEPGYYDAILMDVRMPKLDGLEATEQIRALPRPDAGKIPIIAMTANAFDEDVQRSLQAGMNAHLSKPVEPDHLYETLQDLIISCQG